MDDRRLGSAVRARRHQRGWRLADLAGAAGVGVTACSELERGRAGSMSVRAVRAIAGAIDLPVAWDVGWRRQEVDRLLDHDHSALVSRLVRRLEASGWQARVEVSFNHYGERGRIDVLALHPVARLLLVCEMKTTINDGGDTIGRLDVKARVAPFVARDIGWRADHVVPALFVLAGTTNRRRVRELSALLSRYALRGREALAWLRTPAGVPSGLLVLAKVPDFGGADARRAGRHRVRLRRSDPRSTSTRSGRSSAD